MTDVPDIVDVFVGTPLGTSDHCFVGCVLRVEQSVREHSIRSTVFLEHRTIWDNVCCAVRSFNWSTILKSADPLHAFNRTNGEVIGRVVPTTVLCSKQWLCHWQLAAVRELMMLSRLLIMPGVEHAVQIIGVDMRMLVLRPSESMVLQQSHIMNAPGILPKNSTCSDK